MNMVLRLQKHLGMMRPSQARGKKCRSFSELKINATPLIA
jgi:hypothetical protein